MRVWRKSAILKAKYFLTAMIRILERLQLSNIFLLGFFLVLPLSLRHTFVAWSPLGTSGFNEYTDVSVFLSDLVLLCFILLKILENKRTYLSISWWREMFHVEQWKLAVLSPLPFLLWSLISTLWSENQSLAIYASIKLIEGYLLYLFLLLTIVPRGTIEASDNKSSTWNMADSLSVDHKLFHVEQSQSNISKVVKNVPRGTIAFLRQIVSKCSTWNIRGYVIQTLILSASAQSLVALYQFMAQKSLGLAFLGESQLGAQWPGIAKILMDGEAIVRPYGLFPHPNVLAGFLGFAIILVILEPILGSGKLFHVEQSRLLYRIVLGTLSFVFLVTFSKGAILSLILVLFYIFWQMFHVEQIIHGSVVNTITNVPRGTIAYFKRVYSNCSTWNIHQYWLKLFHVEHFFVGTVFVLVGVVLALVVRSLDWYYFLYQPLTERWLYVQGFFRMIIDSFWLGIGLGQSVFLMQHFIERILFDWEFQPIHNLFLLIWAEVGLVGLVLFGYICSTWNKTTQIPKMFHVEQCVQKFGRNQNNVPRGTIYTVVIESIFSRGILLYILITSLFDHYYWDIQQGQLLFWTVCAVAISLRLRVLTK